MCLGICENNCGCSLSVASVCAVCLGHRDLDDVFAYKTPVVAVIRDRKLGILRLLFMTSIMIYIVIFSLILNKGYAELGSIASTLDVKFVLVRSFDEAPPSVLG